MKTEGLCYVMEYTQCTQQLYEAQAKWSNEALHCWGYVLSVLKLQNIWQLLTEYLIKNLLSPIISWHGAHSKFSPSYHFFLLICPGFSTFVSFNYLTFQEFAHRSLSNAKYLPLSPDIIIVINDFKSIMLPWFFNLSLVVSIL